MGVLINNELTPTTMTTATKISYADTMARYGLVSCDFVYNAETGIEFDVYAQNSETNAATAVTPLFDYNDDVAVEAIKEICLAIVDDAFPDIHNITEVGGSFYPDNGDITFEGNVTTVLAVCNTIN